MSEPSKTPQKPEKPWLKDFERINSSMMNWRP